MLQSAPDQRGNLVGGLDLQIAMLDDADADFFVAAVSNVMTSTSS